MRLRPFAGFDGDAGNREKCSKHGFAIADIEYILASDPPFLAPDVRNSMVEPRYIAVGSTRMDRYAFVVFTSRGRAGSVLLRSISARFMHRKEIEQYENASAGIEER